MSTGLTTSLQGYASPRMTLVIVILLLVGFVVGLFSLFLCRFFLHFRRPTLSPPALDKPLPSGLNPTIISSFPTFNYATVKNLRIEKYGLECAICICEFADEDVLRLLTRCCHVYHQDCVDTWLRKNKTCPVCRDNLEELQSPMMMSGIDEEEPLPDVVEEREGGERVAARVERAEVFNKFPRSHSTGHSIKKRDDLGVDRFTLRLPEHLHARFLRGKNCSCTTFGEFTSRAKMGNGGFGEISDFADGDVNRV